MSEKTYPLTRKDAATVLTILEDKAALRDQLRDATAEIARLTAENEALRAAQAEVTEAMVRRAYIAWRKAVTSNAGNKDCIRAALSARQGEGET